MLYFVEFMLRFVRLVALMVAASIALSACGARTNEEGGDSQPLYNANGDIVSGGDGSPTLGGANPADDLTLRVVSDVNSIATGGADVATITALIADANNNAVASTEVSFRSTGGVLQNISIVTDDNGVAQATLRLLQDFQNQDIIVTVSAGDSEANVKIMATGSELELTGPSNLVSGDTASMVVQLVAGSGEPIANQAVSVSSAAGNTLTPDLLTTDQDGRAQFLVGNGNSSDTITVTALNGSVTATHSFEVVEDLLHFTNALENSEFVVGSEQPISVRWVSKGVPVIGGFLRFSITSGLVSLPSPAVTDREGNATVWVSSQSAGPATITVEAANGGSPKTAIDIQFIATDAHSIAIDASSSRVGTGESSTITALVRDRLGNPVKNQVVRFTGLDLKGGQLSSASATTNSTGVASVTFTAGESATEQNEVAILASLAEADSSDTLSLTVFKPVLNITLGSANLVTIKPMGTQYSMPFLVQVADGSGRPLENATVKVSVQPLLYGKGEMEQFDKDGKTWEEVTAEGGEFAASYWGLADDAIECLAEDLDGDRTLDSIDGVSEDFNGNGSLDPQDPASLTAVDGVIATLSGGALSTDVNGSGYFEFLYPASNAGWAFVEITARAQALGEEATDTYRTLLAVPASVANAVDVRPANHDSPYGTVVDAALRSITVGDRTVRIPAGCTSQY